MYNHQLDTFVQVADLKSFSKAGKALFLSTVSVMNQINSLEKTLEVSLFERTNHGVILTDAGKSLYKDAKKMIRLSEDAARRARSAAAAAQHTVRIGTSILRPCRPLLKLWEQADDGAHPFQIEIVPFEDDPGIINQLLASSGQAIDCLIGPCDSFQWKRQFHVEPLGFCRCCLAVSKKNPLSGRDRLTLHDLSDQSVMLLKRGISPVLDSIRDELEQHPDIDIMEMSNFYSAEVFNECAQRGCIMETLDIWQDVHPSVVTVPVDWNYQVPYGIIYARDASRPLLEFIRRIKTVKTS